MPVATFKPEDVGNAVPVDNRVPEETCTYDYIIVGGELSRRVGFRTYDVNCTVITSRYVQPGQLVAYYPTG